jgi:circadian clock protein KaiC
MNGSMARIPTGTSGLDEVLGGGLPQHALHLVQGAPGVGKTTLGLQFLIEGARRGETTLYVVLTESKPEVLAVAATHGWALDGVHIFDVASFGSRLRASSEQTMFHHAELELEETVGPILAELERLRPTRLVLDSLSEIRLLAQDPLRYRRQLLALRELLGKIRCTGLAIDSYTGENSILETMVAGIIRLEKLSPVYGAARRRLAVDKMRGVKYSEGFHDYSIDTGELKVFPRLVAADYREPAPEGVVSSGIEALDALVHGGIERGTSILLLGAAGTGKSSIATQYAMAAAARGEKSVAYLFEETTGTWRARARSLHFDVDQHLAEGRLAIRQIDPAEMSPGRLAASVQHAVEHDQARIVILDSLNGYLQSVPDETHLILHLHELLTYLGQRGVTTFLILTQQGILGPGIETPFDVSYLADAIILLRYFEAAGEVRKAISAVKKRSGGHERTIREFRLDQAGVRVGEPLRDFHGVLTGVPTYEGGETPLLAGEQ